ncbi:hypothetical protein [Jeotgalicoccus psychrophilus]|uniref:hypothetical protein n=1 Tax=Jeotgalicoccus psychrophilus TaxID=157228 RepID=UPI00041D5B37|nr:hypothetical protein [Jeotgalicoccus psychrophilus]
MSNSAKIIFPEVFNINEVKYEGDNKKGNNNGGGGGMSYVSQETFKQYEKRIDERLGAIDKNISETKSTLKWGVGLATTTLVAVVIGFITVIFNII